MLPEMVNISRAELDKLRERAKRLALEKSYLELVVGLIDKLGSTAGLENAVESMARLVCDTIGGSNVVIHYRMDDEFESVDAYGKVRTSDAIDDEMAAEAFGTRRAIEAAHAFQDTKMLTPEFTKAYALAVPLLVGEEVVGVLKVEDMMMPAREAQEELRAFFSYAALVLKNEIHNYTRLSRAYDELSASNALLTDEIGQRKKAEQELRKSKRGLEAKIRERTRVLRTLSESNQTLMRASNEGRLLEDICKVAVEAGGYRMAWVGLVEHDEQKSIRPVAWAGAEPGYPEHVKLTWDTGPHGRGPAGKSVRWRKPVIARDIQQGSKSARWQAEATERGYRSVISLPLSGPEGEVLGVLVIHAEPADAFGATERALLVELAGDLAFGIEALRERQKRAEAEEGTREAASYARSIIEAAPDALIAINPDGKITDVNEAAEHETGVPRDRLIGSDFTSYFTEPDKARAGFRKVLEEGLVRDFPLTLKRTFGETRDVLYSGTVYRDTAGEPRGVLVTARDVTEAKKVQAQVARLAAIVTSSQDAIFTKDLDGIVTSWNAAAEVLYGCSAQEMIGADVGVLTPPEREGEPRQLVERVRQGERISGFETRRKRKDGSLFDISLTLSPILDDAGGIVAVSVIGRDITDSKRAEREVRESEEKFAAAFSGSPDLLSITRISDGTILEVNEGYERLLGHARAESVEKTTTELSMWADPADRAEFIRRLTESGEVTDFETTLRRTDGTLVPVIDSARTFDLQGETCVLSVVHDITERKRAETALQKSEERLRLEVSRMPIAYIVWDTEFRVVTWNPAAEKIFGYPFEEVEGRHSYETIVPPEAQPQVDDIWSRLLAGDASAHSVNENTTKDGCTIVCDWTNTPLKQPDGTVLGVMSMVQDITERRQAEELRIAKEVAEAANVAKSGFLANMSHEIRTPMNAILGFAQLLRRDPELSERQRQQLDIINSSGEHLLALVNDVLEMAKIESGRVALNPTAFDLYALMDDLGNLFSVQADEKELALHVIRSRDVPRFVIADESRLRQVFVNLLGNAVKFTEKGSVTLRVGIRREKGRALHLVAEVEDTGPGITAQEVDRLFQYFEQAGAGRRAESGTGLGLAISRGFVHLLGGEIAVRSEVGKGSVFSFDVAVEETSEETAAAGAGERHVIGLQAGEQRRRVLVADDAADNRELLVQLLEPIGFEVKAVADGKQAVSEFRSWHPDLILMDMRMPVMDGYEATRRIRATAAGAHIPIIGVTASVFSEMRHEVFAAGVDDFLGKPFSDSELFDKIGRLLGLHYTYEEEAAAVEPEEAGALSAAAIAALPGDLVDRIRRATVAADFDAVLELADEVAQTDQQLAAALRNLAGAFDSERILAVLSGGEAS